MEGKTKDLKDSLDNDIGFNFKYIVRIMVFVTGIFVLAFGAATVIRADLGVATQDAIHIGLSDLTDISVGRWVQIVGVAMVLMTSLFERRRPSIASMLNIILVGFFLNTILNLDIIPNFTNIVLKTTMLIIGVVFMGAGSGMYVASRIGSGPRDGMTLFISKRFSISVRLSRTILEALALATGWLIGGPVSIGTFISIPVVGPVMQVSLRFWVKQLNKIQKGISEKVSLAKFKTLKYIQQAEKTVGDYMRKLGIRGIQVTDITYVHTLSGFVLQSYSCMAFVRQPFHSKCT